MDEQLQAVQEAIQGLHQLMVTLQDPKQVSIVAQCLKALTGIQQEMMQNQQAPNAQQAVLSQLGGQGGGQGGY